MLRPHPEDERMLRTNKWIGVVRVERAKDESGEFLLCRNKSGTIADVVPYDRFMRKIFASLFVATPVLYMEAYVTCDGYLCFTDQSHPTHPF